VAVPDQDRAIELLRTEVRAGDVVLVKGSRYRTWEVADALRAGGAGLAGSSSPAGGAGLAGSSSPAGGAGSAGSSSPAGGAGLAGSSSPAGTVVAS